VVDDQSIVFNKLAVVTLHDAAPRFSKKVFEYMDTFDNLKIKLMLDLFHFYVIQRTFRYPEFVDKLKSYRRCEVALHGLYHEDRNDPMDDFHTITKARAEEELRAALEIFQEVGLRTEVFLPPQWILRNGCKEVLKKLKFSLAEIQEEFLLLSVELLRKIKAPKVLSWDLTGHPAQNVMRIGTENRRFRFLDGAKRKHKMIRIALHPRDPHKAINDQLTMISELRNEGYRFLRYRDLLLKLQDARYTLN
jgi:predicted deacetylase